MAGDEIMEKLIVAKQASDLHTNYLGQRIILQYLQDNDIDEHIQKIRQAYGKQREAMVSAIRDYFPAGYPIHPTGRRDVPLDHLPERLSAMEVFNEAVNRKVAFVPGDPFYVNKIAANTLRLNFSSVDEETIRIGNKTIGRGLREMLSKVA